MKTIYMLLPALAAFLLASCDSSEPGQLKGTIVDAAMHNVVIKEISSSQTAVFSTDGADMSQAHGLLTGNSITIDYKGNLKEVTAATKVVTDATYANAIGDWTMPDPIQPDSVMGIRLMVGGEAESIRMATLRYTGWKLQGEKNKIVLEGIREGSDTPIDFTQTALLRTNAKEGKILLIKGTEIVLTRQPL